MENMIVNKVQKLTGMLGENEKSFGTGILCPGGSFSNMLAINVGRFNFYPEVKDEGCYAIPKICVMTSELSHYSIKKACQIIGIGTKGCRMVKADPKTGAMPAEN